jgi:molecular chaperone DnaJ
MTTAALGGDIEVPTIDGGRSRVKVPQAANLAVRCDCDPRACQRCAQAQVGDMFIELGGGNTGKPDIPSKRLLREFEELSEDNNPKAAAFSHRSNPFGIR